MDLTHDLNDVVKSLQTKLSQSELKASQFEAVIIAKDKKIKELEHNLKEEVKNG